MVFQAPFGKGEEGQLYAKATSIYATTLASFLTLQTYLRIMKDLELFFGKSLTT